MKVVAPEAREFMSRDATENRPTIESDVDVLMVLPRKVNFAKAVELRAKILEKAEKQGLPLYTPVKLHK